MLSQCLLLKLEQRRKAGECPLPCAELDVPTAPLEMDETEL